MKRRDFLSVAGAAAVVSFAPNYGLAQQASAHGARYDNLLILVELKGGNDGLNSVIPYADAQYTTLRPRIAIARDQVLQLDGAAGLHPSLSALMPMWQARELAVVQSVGYPSANLSHFRSIEIWDTASKSNEYLQDGWLARAFARAPTPRSFAADAVVIGGAEMGPVAGGGVRAIALTDTQRFLQQARFAIPSPAAQNAALKHILRVEHDIVQAASGLNAQHVFRTEFPATGFGGAVRTAAQVIASRGGVAAVRLTLNGFDTHSGQQGTQARLLKDLAEGLAALKSAMMELNRWDSTLVMTYAEFGRRPRENLSGGTDHGTASAHFVLGGRIKGGLYGLPPALARLDGNGNLPFAVDFRDLYATVLERWWGIGSGEILAGRFTPLPLV